MEDTKNIINDIQDAAIALSVICTDALGAIDGSPKILELKDNHLEKLTKLSINLYSLCGMIATDLKMIEVSLELAENDE